MENLEDKGDIAGVAALHFNLNTDTTKFRSAENDCTVCTMEHGTFIKPNFEFGDRTSPNFPDIEAPICSAGSQCVAEGENSKTGCCQHCKPEQLCVQATLAFGGEEEAPSWNTCPPGFICNSFASQLANVVVQCGAGEVCLENDKMSCKELRQIPIDAGIGDVHAGSYCPEGEFRMLFCPQGYYCNSTDMSEKFKCPAGKFCPLKTEIPEIDCPGCEEGATELRTDPAMVVAVAIPLMLILFFIFVVRFTRPSYLYKRFKCCFELKEQKFEPKHEAAAEAELQCLRISMVTDVNTVSDKGSRINIDEARILSMIASIQRRVAKISDSSSSSFSEDFDSQSNDSTVSAPRQSIIGKVVDFTVNAIFQGFPDPQSPVMIENFPPVDEENPEKDHRELHHPSYLSLSSMDFDAELVFNKLDTDDDKVLSYEELNSILQLNEVKLKFFVRKMNKMEGLPLETTTISKECFVKHFYETLINTETFDPDFSEAAEIFDALDLDRDGTIAGIELHSTLLETFLTDRQIHVMMKKMSRKDERGNDFIDKETFIDMYPMLLSEVILNSPLEPANTEPGVDITFSDLSLSVNVSGKSLSIIDSVGGRIKEKTMTAIMGGSGTGKTSLLNALCGKAYYGKVSGNILVNGNKARMENYKHLMGFVPQDDIMYAELTVRENLIYAGRFKLPASTTLKEIKELADDVIVNLGLIRVRDSIVGDVRRRGISGGEKKRVNIGLELMGKPRILFLDEPTSGLDAASSSLVMASLKSLVRDDGVTCVSVIHQPRKFIFDLIDNVILLGVGGRIMYHGSPSAARDYFENIGYYLPAGENIADWLLDISTGQLGKPVPDTEEKSITGLPTGQNLRDAREFIFEKWEEHIIALTEEEMGLTLLPPIPFAIPPRYEKPSFFSQLATQVRRNFLVMNRNRMTILFDCIVILVAVTIIASIDGVSIMVDERFIDRTNGVPLNLLQDSNKLPLPDMFFPYLRAAFNYQGDAIKLAVVCSVLVGLNATKMISDKKVEFFRESSSGYNIDAYFVAVNITSTIEHSFQMLVAAVLAFLFRATVSSWGAGILNFIMLGWGCVSWALLFSVVIPPKNLIIVTGFFMSFFSILLGGGIPPFDFEAIYASRILQLICGFFSPSRFFIETFIVSDFKCLPEQTGFTLGGENVYFRSFEELSLGLHDKNITEQSCSGWYYNFAVSFVTGLTVRVAAGILLHIVNRSELSQLPIRVSLKTKSFQKHALLSSLVFVLLVLISIHLIFF